LEGCRPGKQRREPNAPYEDVPSLNTLTRGKGIGSGWPAATFLSKKTEPTPTTLDREWRRRAAPRGRDRRRGPGEGGQSIPVGGPRGREGAQGGPRGGPVDSLRNMRRRAGRPSGGSAAGQRHSRIRSLRREPESSRRRTVSSRWSLRRELPLGEGLSVEPSRRRPLRRELPDTLSMDVRREVTISLGEGNF
jgi:hypothetical protein